MTADARRLAERWKVIGACPEALAWLKIQADLGLAPRTIEAYARGLTDYLAICDRDGVDPVLAERSDVARYVHDLKERPSHRGTNVVHFESGVGLANATLQQRLVAVRLFYDYLMEEGRRDSNPVGRGATHQANSSGSIASVALFLGLSNSPGFRRTSNGTRFSGRRKANVYGIGSCLHSHTTRHCVAKSCACCGRTISTPRIACCTSAQRRPRAAVSALSRTQPPQVCSFKRI
jgi:hypothetical protein